MGGQLIDKIGSYSGPSSFGAPSRSFMKSTNARTLGESSRSLAKAIAFNTRPEDTADAAARQLEGG